MLARLFRFHGHNTVPKVYRQGKVVRSQHLALKFVHADDAATKVAVVVSKKVHKSAVVRNRIRRRLYARIAPLIPRLKTPVHVVVTLFDDKPATLPSRDVDEIILQLFKKAGLIN